MLRVSRSDPIDRRVGSHARPIGLLPNPGAPAWYHRKKHGVNVSFVGSVVRSRSFRRSGERGAWFADCVEAGAQLPYAPTRVRTKKGRFIPAGHRSRGGECRVQPRVHCKAFGGIIRAGSKSNATSDSEAGELMGRTRVVALIVLATLLVSGARDERAAQPVAAANPVATAASIDFDATHLMRFLEWANASLSPNQIQRIAAAVMRYSAKYGLDPLLVTQVLWVESGARPWVRSPLGAVGLMQVMPHMAEQLELAGNLATIDTNIEAGCWILADNIRRLGEEDGISAYFWGSDIRSVVYLDRVKKARAAVRGASES